MDATHGRTNGHIRCREGGDPSESGRNELDSESFSDSVIRVEYEGVALLRKLSKMN